MSAGYANEEALRAFFGEPGWREHRFDSAQHFDLDGLRGRLLSSSYTPEGPATHAASRCSPPCPPCSPPTSAGGQVAFEYDTRLFTGRLS